MSKLAPPSEIFQYEWDFDYQPRKRELNLKVTAPIAILSRNAPEKQEEIAYVPKKTVGLIDIPGSLPEQLRVERAFFDSEITLFHKPLKLSLVEQKTGGIAVTISSRKEIEFADIQYNSKVRFYQVPSPPTTVPVILEEDRIYIDENGIGYNPLKELAENQSRISIGTVDLQTYRLEFSNPFLDTLISNDTNRFFFKNDSLLIGAQASMGEITGIAFFPGFDFKTDLFDNCFVMRTVAQFERLPSFDFGLGLINTTPIPIINWYTLGTSNLFTIGVDIFARSSYGLNIRLKNNSYLIGGSTGYDFSNDGFHAMIDGKYTFDKGLFSAGLSYNDGIGLNLGTQYQLIKDHPFSMNIYGNIDYRNDWLFSAGTKIRIGDVDLNVKIKFITGGLSVDVEAGYSF
ncbi:MAG: hypothetical protein ACLFQE_07485 [Thermotogota bacterium]